MYVHIYIHTHIYAGIVVSTIFEWAIVREAIGSRTNTVGDVAEVSGSPPMPVKS